MPSSSRTINDVLPPRTTTTTTTKKKKSKNTKPRKPKRQPYSKLSSSSSSSRRTRSTNTTTTTTTTESQDTTATTSYTTILTENLLYYQTLLRRSLPHPTHTNTATHRHLYSTASLVLFFCFVAYSVTLQKFAPFPSSSSSFAILSSSRGGGGRGGLKGYEDAYQESFGFFTDIPNKDWMYMKERVKNQPYHNDEKKGLRSKYADRNDARAWYQNNWNPDFTCPHELRVGGTGDGPKWVCDPHRIATYYQNIQQGKNDDDDDGCLIYSVGDDIFKNNNNNNNNNPFAFEIGMQQAVGGPTVCEIHVFDPHYTPDIVDGVNTVIPEGIILHPWGIEGTKDISKGRTNFMTLQETIQHLNHEHRIIDVLKMDCEECEWNAYSDWFSTNMDGKTTTTTSTDIRQILVELHGTPKNDVDFFERLRMEGYVIFHKEADTQYGGIWQEYGFLKLSPDFFKD